MIFTFQNLVYQTKKKLFIEVFMISILNQSGVVPPKEGTPILYSCMSCGENFAVKKSFFRKHIKCPKCGSSKCISPVVN